MTPTPEEQKKDEPMLILGFLISAAIWAIMDEKGRQSYKQLESLTREIRR